MGLAYGIVSIAGLCGLIGWIWATVLAFQNGDTIWGVFSILTCGLVGLIWGIMHFQQAKVPVILMGISILGSVLSQVLGMGAQ